MEPGNWEEKAFLEKDKVMQKARPTFAKERQLEAGRVYPIATVQKASSTLDRMYPSPEGLHKRVTVLPAIHGPRFLPHLTRELPHPPFPQAAGLSSITGVRRG